MSLPFFEDGDKAGDFTAVDTIGSFSGVNKANDFDTIFEEACDNLEQTHHMKFTGDFLKLGAIWLTLGKSAIQNFIKGAQASAASVQKIFSNIFSKIPKISFKTSDAKMQLNSLKNQINTIGDTVTTLDGKEITIKAKYEGLSAEELKNKLNSGDISDDERNYINARISEEEKSAIINPSNHRKRGSRNAFPAEFCQGAGAGGAQPVDRAQSADQRGGRLPSGHPVCGLF